MNATLTKIRAWLSHPVNALVGSIGAIASILSIFLYFQSIEKRDLNFYVHPVKATVVKAGQASKLTVSFDGHEITNDITAVQIAFWNAGKRPIKKAEILEPIVISCGVDHPILEASLKKTTRPLTHPVLETTKMENGEIGISWDILEQSDGGVVQVVYTGGTSVSFQMRGTIEGQGTTPLKVSSEILRPPGEGFAPGKSRKARWVSVALCAGTVFFAGSLAFLHRKDKGLMRVAIVFLLCCVFFMLANAVWALLRTPDGPPFSF